MKIWLFVVTDGEYKTEFITEGYRSLELATLVQIAFKKNNIHVCNQ